MSKNDLGILLAKYASGTLSPSEKEELTALLHNPQYEEDLKALIDEKFAGTTFNEKPSPEIAAIIFQRIMKVRKMDEGLNAIGYKAPKSKIKPWLYAAAAVTLVLSLAALFFTYKHTHAPGTTARTSGSGTDARPVAAPTNVKAYLTLANGEVITLDSLGRGKLAQQGNATVVKLADGEIAYRAPKGTVANEEVLYNILNVPRGSRVVSVTLSDGTKVWLNAASSLKYPAVFAAGARKVEVTGEVYFEVVSAFSGKQKNRKAPFIVRVNDQVEVNVLGTHFNVHAYEQEPLAITLLEGAVTINNGNVATMLRPGQQAQLATTGTIAVKPDADTEQVMAWKNGYFQFEGSDIKEVMGEITRWYDIEVQYEGNVLSQHFRGTISRNADAAKVFKMLEATDAVHFKMEGKKVIVTP